MCSSRSLKRKKRVILHFASTYRHLAKDLDIETSDRNYVLRRLQQEGVSFLSKTLPLFSKYVLMCIEHRRLLPASECGLTHFKLKGRSPLFMRGLLLDAISGNASALYRIRQFCEYYYKLSFKFKESQLANSTEKYLKTEQECQEDDENWNTVEEARKAFHALFPSLANATVNDILSYRPAYGPGAFAGSELLSEPFELYKKLPADMVGSHHSSYNAYSGFFRNSRQEMIKPVAEPKICQIRFVPKDSRGARVISKEPMHLLRGQMAYGKFLADQLPKLSRKRINFGDQSVNQELARKASIDGRHATLDLKDASDRVRYRVVSYIFKDTKGLRWFLANARSTHYEVLYKGKRIVRRLCKFANMGSGMCFPTLSLIVYLAAVIGVKRYEKCSIFKAAKSVYVYGDDLIVPSGSTVSVRNTLTEFGLLVNDDKSFSKGSFRESCGGDYLNGVSVAPVRLRLSNAGISSYDEYRNNFLPITADSGLLQLERHCRELVDSGLQNLADYYYKNLERVFGSMPIVARDSHVLGRYSITQVPTNVDTMCYVPTVKHVVSDLVCPYKGIYASLANASAGGLNTDWTLTPLRRSIVIKRRVVEASNISCYGLTAEPNQLWSNL